MQDGGTRGPRRRVCALHFSHLCPQGADCKLSLSLSLSPPLRTVGRAPRALDSPRFAGEAARSASWNSCLATGQPEADTHIWTSGCDADKSDAVMVGIVSACLARGTRAGSWASGASRSVPIHAGCASQPKSCETRRHPETSKVMKACMDACVRVWLKRRASHSTRHDGRVPLTAASTVAVCLSYRCARALPSPRVGVSARHSAAVPPLRSIAPAVPFALSHFPQFCGLRTPSLAWPRTR